MLPTRSVGLASPAPANTAILLIGNVNVNVFGYPLAPVRPSNESPAVFNVISFLRLTLIIFSHGKTSLGTAKFVGCVGAKSLFLLV